MNAKRTSRLHNRRTKVTAVVLLALALGASMAVAAPSDLDSSFDGDGLRTIDYGGTDAAQDVLVQPDGKIVLAGWGGLNNNFVVTRLNPNGSYDPDFGGGGTSGFDFGGIDDGYAAALQADGKIVVAGTTNAADAAVARLNANGSVDGSFGPGGQRTIDYGGADAALDVLVQPDGKIVLAGRGGLNNNFVVTRLNPNGSYDPDFGGGGTSGFDFGGTDRAYAVALQADGKIVVAGSTNAGDGDAAVARLNANGSVDGSFGPGGQRTIDYGSVDAALDVLVQPDGKIVLAGEGGLNNNFVVTRLNPNGSYDSDFGGGGTSGFDFGGIDEGYAAALQANGKIVVAGTTSAGNRAAVARLQPGGAVDTSFNLDGKQTISVGTSTYAYATALQANGRILIAGEANEVNNWNALVARLDGDSGAAGGGPGGGGPGGGPGGGGGGGQVPRCNGKRATIVGSDGADRLKGTRRADVIVALAGNDRIKAGAGKDTVCAGAGKDRVAGGPGKDRVVGGPGNDRLDGGPGNDRLAGQGGKDTLLGRTGNDKLNGGAGRDKERQ
jgi:uncharacterized delta-60 repeat protein